MASDDGMLIAAAIMYAGSKKMGFSECLEVVLDADRRMLASSGGRKCTPDGIMLAAIQLAHHGVLQVDSTIGWAFEIANDVDKRFENEEQSSEG